MVKPLTFQKGKIVCGYAYWESNTKVVKDGSYYLVTCTTRQFVGGIHGKLYINSQLTPLEFTNYKVMNTTLKKMLTEATRGNIKDVTVYYSFERRYKKYIQENSHARRVY